MFDFNNQKTIPLKYGKYQWLDFMKIKFIISNNNASYLETHDLFFLFNDIKNVTNNDIFMIIFCLKFNLIIIWKIKHSWSKSN